MKIITSTHRILIACGVLVAPVFYLVSITQVVSRPDYDALALPLSFLALGENGWIQVVNFLVTGALAVAAALGLGRALTGRGRRALPVLVGLYGLGMIGAGLFPADPLPVPGVEPAVSTSGLLHMLSFFLAFLSLIAACFVAGWRFVGARQSLRAIVSIAVGVAAPVLVGASGTNPAMAGVIVGAGGVLLFGWLGLLCQIILRDTATASTSLIPSQA